MMRPYWPATVPDARTKTAALEFGIWFEEVPISSVPPGFTTMLPPTSVSVEETTRLNESVPLIVVVLAVALLSRVTVSPARISTALHAVGTKYESHVAASDQAPEPTLVNVEQLNAPPPQTILLFGSFRV